MSIKSKTRRSAKDQARKENQAAYLARGGSAKQHLETCVSSAQGAIYYQVNTKDRAPRQFYVVNVPVVLGGKIVAYQTVNKLDRKGNPIPRPISKYPDGAPRWSFSNTEVPKEKEDTI